MDSVPSVTTTRASQVAAESESAWLTTILRPAGSLDRAQVRRLGDTLGQLAGASDMVIVDLGAVDIRDPHPVAKALREPAAEFERAGLCLLVIGAPSALTAELDRAEIPVVTLASDAIPRPRAA